MQVFVLSTCYPRRSRRNHGIFIHRQTRALAALGAECHVIQPIPWSPPPPIHHLHPTWKEGFRDRHDVFAELEGVPIHHPRIFFPKPSRLFPGDYWHRIGLGVGGFLRSFTPRRDDAVLLAHFLCHEGYAGLVGSRSTKIPLVAVARGDDVHAWPRRWPDRQEKLRAVTGGADGLVAASHSLARDVERWMPRRVHRKVSVVYNGINTEDFHPPTNLDEKITAKESFGLPSNGKVLLCIATPIVEKGWLELFAAFARLVGESGSEEDEWTLVGVGAPRDADDLDLTARATRSGIAGRFRWLGTLAPEQVPRLLRASDAFVLASHDEGLSNAVLEAMATGLPVVATDVGGHSEVIVDGRSGLLVPPRDVDRLAQALEQVVREPEISRRLGEQARSRAIAHGDEEENAEVLLAYLHEVAERAAAA
ncbi:MAG TPA: glycosyltransferase [Thermoanaerobaculia bacterium]|nr:glycosyltransferase [Thermoanaerobaculia bacterium]